MRLAFSSILLLALAFVLFSYYVSQPLEEGRRGDFMPIIADRDIALTFARSPLGLILVTEHLGDAIRGINLSAWYGEEQTKDLINFLALTDRDVLIALDAAEEQIDLNSLIMPISYSPPSIAAGTNFKEHADEVYSEDPPFLFPKVTPASNWNANVPFLPRLDYEAELCLFPLSDITTERQTAEFGLVLCNDFTDRLTLIREIDLGAPLGLTGFASGKGCAGCLPTGYLTVIPHSETFYLSVELALFVNDELRQSFRMQDIIMPIEDIVDQALQSHGSQYTKGEDQIPLMPGKTIPQGTLILTGTAAGVLFKPLNIWNQGFYLQPGDHVRTEATFLGHLENKIVD